MAVFRDDVAELDEELHPLGGEVAEPQPARRRKVAGFVALGLGVAAVASYVLAPGQPKAGAVSIQGLQGKSEDTPLVLHQNLGSYITDDAVKEEGNHGLGASLGNSADKLFAHVVEKSGIDEELDSQELLAFKYRFIALMVDMANSNRGLAEDYVSRARRHIEGAKPVITKALVKAVNAAGHPFKIELRPWMRDESMDSLQARLIQDSVPFEVSSKSKGEKFDNSLPQEKGVGDPELPSSFDPAEHWPKCKDTINSPHNQGRCGSCWIFGAMGSLDSRMCIASDGLYSGANAVLSRGFGASCVVASNSPSWNGCEGGWPHLVFDYIHDTDHPGIPSTNCVPYFGGADYADHWHNSMGAPACPKECNKNHEFPRTMAEDMFKPLGITPYQLVDRPDATGIINLKEALYKEGPVSYAFNANSIFMGYSSGVFNSACGSQPNHAVQALGWGTEDGHDFILSLNSWGTGWGLDGLFKVAPCVVSHFVIPGTIHGHNYPVPVPNWK